MYARVLSLSLHNQLFIDIYAVGVIYVDSLRHGARSRANWNIAGAGIGANLPATGNGEFDWQGVKSLAYMRVHCHSPRSDSSIKQGELKNINYWRYIACPIKLAGEEAKKVCFGEIIVGILRGLTYFVCVCVFQEVRLGDINIPSRFDWQKCIYFFFHVVLICIICRPGKWKC